MTTCKLYCHTCKTVRHLGLGCYGTWGDVFDARTPEAFWDSLSDEDRRLAKNLESLSAIADHQGHNFVIHSDAVDDENIKSSVSDYCVEACAIWENDPAYT